MTTFQDPIALIGLVSRSSMKLGANHPDCPRFGLFEPVYHTAEGRAALAQGPNGIVTGYTFHEASTFMRGLIPFGQRVAAPRKNDPVHVGLICRRPNGELVGLCRPWDEVAAFACGEPFEEICRQMRMHPHEGYHLGRFMTDDVERYVQHAIAGGSFDFEQNAPQLGEYRRIRNEILSSHPEFAKLDQPRNPRGPMRGGFDPSLN